MTDEGYRLVVPTRRAYGVGAAGRGEDYVTDAEDVAPLLYSWKVWRWPGRSNERR